MNALSYFFMVNNETSEKKSFQIKNTTCYFFENFIFLGVNNLKKKLNFSEYS